MDPAKREYPDLIPYVQKLRPYIDTTCYPDYEGQRAVFEPSPVVFASDFEPPPPAAECFSARVAEQKDRDGMPLHSTERRLLDQLRAMRRVSVAA